MRLSLFAPIDHWLAPAPQADRVAWLAGVTFAHRGLHDMNLPENSPAAFAAAITRGFGIECDIQRSADGQAMVFHDWELDRLTAEKGPVAKRTAAQLQDIAIKATDQRIPTLRRVLDRIDGRVPLLIEIKSRREIKPNPVCSAVRRVLEGYRGPHAVMSFDPRVTRWFAKNSPHTVRGLVVTEEDKHGLQGCLSRRLALWRAKPDFLAYDVRDLPSHFAAAQRARGLPVTTWTVRDAVLAECAALHADAPIAEGAGIPRETP